MSSYKRINLPTVQPSEQRQLDKDMIHYLNERDQNLDAILNRGISFLDNVDCRIIEFTSSGTPNAENTVAHGLGKTPTGYFVISQDKAAKVYNGSTSWTATNIYLKADTASVAVKAIVF